MKTTENFARTQWCPLARVATDGLAQVANRGQRGNGDIIIPHGSRCIGSECQAWRWDAPKTTSPYKDDAKTRLGYCGAFGKPDHA